jgi:hypothetical protein
LVQQTGQALDQTNTQISQEAEKTGTGWLQYFGNLVYDVLPRIVAGVGALILIGMGLWLIGRNAPAPTIGIKK